MAPQPNWQPDPQLLAAYFDGELEGRDDLADLRARIETWMEAHPQAAEEYLQQQQLKSLWRETTPAEPPAAMWDRALERVQARKPRALRTASAARYWLGAGALAACVALVFGILFGPWRWHTLADPIAPVALAPKSEPTQEDEILPVAIASEVTILRIEGADTGALVVGELPVSGPLELADAGEVRVVHVQPDARDQMCPHVRQDGPHRPMIWARLETE